MSPTKKVLTAISSPEIVNRLETLFVEANADVSRAHDGETVLALGIRRRFDVIVADFPFSGSDLLEVIERLAGSDSMSAKCPVVVLARPAYRPALRRLSETGRANLTACTSVNEVLKVTARLLDLNDRVTERLLVQIEMIVDSLRVQRVVQTQNISASGMLLKTQRILPVGSVLPFSLELPYDIQPIHGRAQVVRHSDLESEDTIGMGVKFLGLDGDGGQRLGSFIQLNGPAPRAS